MKQLLKGLNKGIARTAMVAVVLAVGMLLSVPSLHAATFNLTSDHCTGGCGTAPFGTVTVNQNGANVDFLVSLLGTNRFVLSGAADFMYFKFNGAPSLASITVDQTAAGVHLIASTGALNGDGTGNFTYGITCDTGASCGNGGSNALLVGTTLSFHVANTTVAAVTGGNNLGNVFVADILSGTTGNTGPVDATPQTQVPEASSFMLLGISLVGFGMAAHRRRVTE